MNFERMRMAYIELLEKANNAETYDEHREYENKITGFLDCSRAVGFTGLLSIGDMHYINQGIDRPMCGGLWLDWEPKIANTGTTYDINEE